MYGFSDKKLARLATAGFKTPADFLLRLPETYLDYSRVVDGQRSLPTFGFHCVEGVVIKQACKVTGPSTHKIDEKPVLFTLQLKLHGFTLSVWDNRRLDGSPLKRCVLGDTVSLYGKLSRRDGMFVIEKPDVVPENWTGKVRPSYKPVNGVIKRSDIAILIQGAVDNADLINQACDIVLSKLGPYQVDKEELNYALYQAHRPDSLAEARRCRRILDDINIKTLLAKHQSPGDDVTGAALALTNNAIELAYIALDFPLSESQGVTINRIIQALKENRPLDMLVSGDVGSGKTIIQLVAAAIVHLSGFNAAIIAPNELLAKQIFKEMQAYMPNIPCEYVGGGEKPKMAHPHTILIGTTAVIHYLEKIDHPLHFVSIDEQQKLGVKQKEQLVTPTTNMIECTATCIPRSMGNILFTGKEISRIYPHTTKNIKSLIIDQSGRRWMFEQVKMALDTGKRVAIIYPEIDVDSRSGLLTAEQFWSKNFPGQYSVLFGRMKSKEKRDKIDEVLSGSKPILLATSIIEIGLDIPDLSLLIAIDADRHGASTLHQMRGRLARNGGQGTFIMYHNGQLNDRSKERLHLVKRYNDGFKIAENDMEARGVGDIIGDGIRQSGDTLGVFIGCPIDPAQLSNYFREANQGYTHPHRLVSGAGG